MRDDLDPEARELLQKVAEEHYGPELADLLRAALVHLPNWARAREAASLLRKIDAGRLPE